MLQRRDARPAATGVTPRQTSSDCAASESANGSGDWKAIVSSSHVVHTSLPDTTPEQARDVRVRAWAFVFDCYAKKKAADVTSTDGSDTKVRSSSDDSRANEASIPR